MSYNLLNTNVRLPMLSGVAAYSPIMTSQNDQGLRTVRLGAIGPTSIVIGPDGQWSVAAGSQPTPTNLWDEFMQWAAAETVFTGVPNILLPIGALFGFFALRGRR
jgi:hypothetical protein